MVMANKMAVLPSQCQKRLQGSYLEISKYFNPKNTTSHFPKLRYYSHHVQGTRAQYRRISSSKPFGREPLRPERLGFVEKFKDSLAFPAATHEIKPFSITLPFKQEKVVLHGYLGSRTDLSKNFFFIPLLSRSLDYSIQIISSARSSGEKIKPAHEKLKTLEEHTPVVVRGLLKLREAKDGKDLGKAKKISNVEIELGDVQSLNEFPKDIIAASETVFPPEQRHLQLKFDKKARDFLAFRAEAASLCKDSLRSMEFLEVETPLLFKSTPEGAREFLVPTRRKGYAYALPQSPQQFKQILMASGISRYYQLAKCFRDEDGRADRQPEFTQVDLEMSFATGEDVMSCIEALIRTLWNDMLNIELPSPFPRLTYLEAMSKYGSDKPDIRLGMPISRIDYLLPADLINMITPLTNPIVEVLVFRQSSQEHDADQTLKFISNFMESSDGTVFQTNPEGGPGIFVYNSRKPLQGLQSFGFEAAEEVERLFEPEDGDLIVLQARKNSPFTGGSTSLGNFRLALHKAAVSQGLVEAPPTFEPLWVTDFPLFSPTNASEPGQGGSAGLASTHHPFTSPKSAADVDLLFTDPSQVIGEHYDLVINGVELGGGSRRIHNSEMQRFIMEDILKMGPERVSEFEHLLEVLRAGCPPHAGIALGFDRLVAVMLGRASVRDVIAFPKSGKGEDPLVKSPGLMNSEALETYHLQVKDGD